MSLVAYNPRLVPPDYDKGWLLTEHQNIQHATDSVSAGIPSVIAAADYALLNTLINTTMQPAGGLLNIVGAVRVTQNLSVPSNVKLQFLPGAMLSPDVGVTVTINSTTTADRRQIFGGLGTVLFSATSGQTEAYPEWFGAKGDSDGVGGGTNDAPAFTKTLTALAPTGKPAIAGGNRPGGVGALVMGVTRYRMSATFVPANYTHTFIVRGQGGRQVNIGQAATSLIFDTGVAGIRLIAQTSPTGDPSYALLEGFEIAAAGRRLGAAVEGFYSEVPFIYRNFSVRQFAGTGMHIKSDSSNPPTNANRFTASDGSVSLCGADGVWIEGNGTNAASFQNVLSGDNLGYGFRDDSEYGMQCWNCEGANNTLGDFNNVQKTDALFERQTTLVGCYDGDGPVISVLRYPAVIVGGVLAFQTKVAAPSHNDAAIWPPVQGTWTPTLVPATSGTVTPNLTYTGGRWTKIGRQVIVQGTYLVSSMAAPVGAITIQGMSTVDDGNHPAPWLTPASQQKLYTAFSVCGSGYNNAAGIFGLAGRLLPGSLNFELNKVVAGGITALLASDLLVGTDLFFTISYTTGD